MRRIRKKERKREKQRESEEKKRLRSYNQMSTIEKKKKKISSVSIAD